MAEQTNQPAQYDALAPAYDLLWQVPAVRPLFPILTSTIQSTGSFEKASVLDLACGTGIGLRILRSLGASRLVGVDISAQMLDIARNTVQGVELHAADCSQPLTHLASLEPGSFDVVLGFWLLNYAPSSTELCGVWSNIARYLRSRRHFIGIIENHVVALPASVASMTYRAIMSDVRDLENGEGWSVHVSFSTQPKIEFDAFKLKREVLEREATRAGFGEIQYSKPSMNNVRSVVDEGIGGDEGKYETWWTELVENPPNYVIVTQKR